MNGADGRVADGGILVVEEYLQPGIIKFAQGQQDAESDSLGIVVRSGKQFGSILLAEVAQPLDGGVMKKCVGVVVGGEQIKQGPKRGLGPVLAGRRWRRNSAREATSSAIAAAVSASAAAGDPGVDEDLCRLGADFIVGIARRAGRCGV